MLIKKTIHRLQPPYVLREVNLAKDELRKRGKIYSTGRVPAANRSKLE
jgi:hypothetical protein